MVVDENHVHSYKALPKRPSVHLLILLRAPLNKQQHETLVLITGNYCIDVFSSVVS